MKKYSKGLILTLFLTSMLIPFFPIAKAQVTDVFIGSSAGPRSLAHWDSPTAVVSTGDYYVGATLETLFRPREQLWDGGNDGAELLPVLATSWVLTNRPDEMNEDGFMNYDGVESVEITLRSGVKFHDGSDWNATVCKWNIDRLMTIIGNISGITPVVDSNMGSRRDTFWLEQADWAPYESPSWNVTQYAGKPGEYPGFGTSTESKMMGRWPRFYNVTITQDLQSGGTLIIHFGDWASGMNYLWGIIMISMYSYGADYSDTAILGYGLTPPFLQPDISGGYPTTGFPGHLIGTGPYVFEEHVSDIGTLHRWDDWWNATAQQAEGWHTVENVALATFAHTEAGYQARNTAMVTGDIDCAYDRTWEPVNYKDMKKAPNVRYVPLGVESYGENIILNCINETFMWTWANVYHLNMSSYYPTLKGAFVASGVMNPDGTMNAHGINRAFRKALSYAFDYDTWIHVAMEDRVVRSGGYLCTTNPYYNPSIPIATHNLTIARQALLDDPYWGAKCAARGLDESSSDSDWRTVAETNPIYSMEYSWDDAHLESYSVMSTSLTDIGCDLADTEAWKDVPDTYTKMSAYFTFPWTITDGFALKLGYTRVANLGYLEAYYKSPASSIFPYDQFYNMGFCYNTTYDNAIKKVWFQNETGVQESYDFLSDWIQNYQYPTIYLGNDLRGMAIAKDWDFSFFWGVFRFNFIKPREPGAAPLIPGYSLCVILPVGIMAISGIGYTIIRKKKHA
ncbi:MAG: ABC transporter substrate-binding protein [Promethearchaeota archaeon]